MSFYDYKIAGGIIDHSLFYNFVVECQAISFIIVDLF